MMKKTKIGILMRNSSCPTCLRDTLDTLAANARIELYLLRGTQKTPGGIRRVMKRVRDVGLLRFASIAFFNMVELAERRVLGALDAGLRRHYASAPMEESLFRRVIELSPVRSKRGISVTYPVGDIEKILALDLDLIVRGNEGAIIKGAILGASKEGIISFHHGDNRWNRGGPPGFWEVYLKREATGFIVQLLTETLDGGSVIYRGEVATRRTFTENQVHVKESSNPLMAQIIERYAATGNLPPAYPPAPFSHALLRTPKFSVTAAYLLRNLRMFAALFVKRKLLKRNQRWHVAFARAEWKNLTLSTATVIESPKGRFFADPFVASRDGQQVIFVEDYHYAAGEAAISAIALQPGGGYQIIPDVIKEPFHLSFPFTFEFDGALYMVPESSASGTIRLYQCVQFPDRWEFKHELMQGVCAADTMLFEHGGRWWLLTNLATDYSRKNRTQLFAFSADSPLSTEWVAHTENPIRFEAIAGRNGGLLRGADGAPYRVGQKPGFCTYGAGIRISEIVRLDQDNFSEVEYCDVEARFAPGLVGMHHMHSHGGVTVFDFARDERPN